MGIGCVRERVAGIGCVRHRVAGISCVWERVTEIDCVQEGGGDRLCTGESNRIGCIWRERGDRLYLREREDEPCPDTQGSLLIDLAQPV